MKRIITTALSLLAGFPVMAQETYFSTDFNSGIPREMTLLNYDELAVGSGFRISVKEKWFSGDVYGADGKAALSTSRRQVDLPTDNWMVTPKINVRSAGAWLTWDARSAHSDLRDGYKVMVSTTGTDVDCFQTIETVEEETYGWNHHLVSLEEYVGKDIYIAFVHDSQSKFILAIDNIFVGVPASVQLQGLDESRRFCGDTGTATVKGRLRNNGCEVRLASLVCTTGSGEAFSEELDGETLATAAEKSFSFDIPVEVGKASSYLVEAVLEDSSRVKLFADSVVCSYFPRKLLVEKSTATWCTACPAVITYINDLKERYKDELICVEVHSAYSNESNLGYEPYETGLNPKNYPSIYYNRELKSPYYGGSATNKLPQILMRPTEALVELEAERMDSVINVKVHTTFAKDVDNATGQYRIGFAIVEKCLQLPYTLQRSNAVLLNNQEYGMMSSPINKDLMFYHDVVRGTSSAFDGVKNSLPATIVAGETYDYDGTIQMPESVTDMENVEVIAFVLDAWSNALFNAAEAKPEAVPTGVARVAGNPCFVSVRKGGFTVRVADEATPYTVDLLAADGRIVAAYTATGRAFSAQVGVGGCYIVRVRQGNNIITQKIIL